MKLLVILLSLLMGLSFLVGNIISHKFNKKWMSYFATSLAFMVIIGVLITDIIPELYESIHNYYEIGIFIFSTLFSIGLLFIIDQFIPHHNHEHVHNDETKKDHKEHLYHIALLTLISVTLHNILEGIAFYMIGISSIRAALLMAGGIALHNIPLGIEMSCFFEKKKSNHIKKYLLLIVSGTIGSLIGLIIGDVSNITNVIIMSLTMGLMLYISLHELGVEAITNFKEKGTKLGFLVGIIIIAVLFI